MALVTRHSAQDREGSEWIKHVGMKGSGVRARGVFNQMLRASYRNCLLPRVHTAGHETKDGQELT